MTPDYTLTNLVERAAEAKKKHKSYIDELLENYERRQRWRRKRAIPSVGYCGMGRAGKDTAAEFYCAHTGTKYPGSSSQMVLPIIATMVGISEEQAFAERHQHREFWIDACHAIRNPDFTLLLRMCLGAGDVAVGCRGRLELYHAVRDKILDVTIWIDNPRVPNDPTVEYGPEDCDFMVPNRGSHSELYSRIERVVSLMKTRMFIPKE